MLFRSTIANFNSTATSYALKSSLRSSLTTDTLIVYNNCNMNTTPNITGDGSSGTIRCLPTSDGLSSSIGFYRNNNGGGSGNGTFWGLGHNMYSVGAGNLALGCNNLTSVMTFNCNTGIIDCGYGLTIKGQSLPSYINNVVSTSLTNINTTLSSYLTSFGATSLYQPLGKIGRAHV